MPRSGGSSSPCDIARCTGTPDARRRCGGADAYAALSRRQPAVADRSSASMPLARRCCLHDVALRCPTSAGGSVCRCPPSHHSAHGLDLGPAGGVPLSTALLLTLERQHPSRTSVGCREGMKRRDEREGSRHAACGLCREGMPAAADVRWAQRLPSSSTRAASWAGGGALSLAAARRRTRAERRPALHLLGRRQQQRGGRSAVCALLAPLSAGVPGLPRRARTRGGGVLPYASHSLPWCRSAAASRKA
jgi:hypothetical protein